MSEGDYMFDCIVCIDGGITSCKDGDLYFNIVWDDEEFEEEGLCYWAFMDDAGKFYGHGAYKSF